MELQGSAGRRHAPPYTREALIAELKRVAAVVRGHYSQSEFRRASPVSLVTVLRQFGAWPAALKAAGLRRRALPRAIGGKYTWRQCYDNLDKLYRRLQRAPRRFEMDCPPSTIGSMAYIARFGAWRLALAAYEAHRAGDDAAWPMPAEDRAGHGQGAYAHGRAARARRDARGPAKIELALRHKVLTRDNFKCVACGASPANDPKVRLHIDHATPRALGGKTDYDNLQTLCAPCNLRKATLEEVV